MINLQLATKWQPGCPATSRPECAAPKWRAECATTRRPEWTAASWRPEWTATKWRHDVAMGVSPWNTNPHRAMSPKGTTGNPLHQIMSPLRGFVLVSNSKSTGWFAL